MKICRLASLALLERATRVTAQLGNQFQHGLNHELGSWGPAAEDHAITGQRIILSVVPYVIVVGDLIDEEAHDELSRTRSVMHALIITLAEDVVRPLLDASKLDEVEAELEIRRIANQAEPIWKQVSAERKVILELLVAARGSTLE